METGNFFHCISYFGLPICFAYLSPAFAESAGAIGWVKNNFFGCASNRAKMYLVLKVQVIPVFYVHPNAVTETVRTPQAPQRPKENTRETRQWIG